MGPEVKIVLFLRWLDAALAQSTVTVFFSEDVYQSSRDEK